MVKWANSLRKSGTIRSNQRDAVKTMVDDVMNALLKMEVDLAMQTGRTIQSMESPPADTDAIVAVISDKMDVMQAPPNTDQIAIAVTDKIGKTMAPPPINLQDLAKAVATAIPPLSPDDIATAVTRKMEGFQVTPQFNAEELAEAVTNRIAQPAIPPNTLSYANVVKVPTSMQITPNIPPRQHSIVVFPELPPGKDPPPSSETRKRIMDTLRPQETGIQIAAVRNMGRSGGIMIATTSADAQARLLNHPALTSEGLRTELAKRELPRLKIFDVPKEMNGAAIAQAVRLQNMDDVSSEEFGRQFKIVHMFASKIRNNIIIAECTPAVRQRLLHQGRIYIQFESCRVLDYIQVTRCFKCQGYGHPAKYCTATADTCSLCAGPHFHTACPHKDSPQTHKCANCARAKLEDQAHPAISLKCPAYIRALDNSIRRTDYGDT
ncbi:hypothetical protein RI129_004852 [Pyrocoelia pectoralis]|uniref:Gag-like protein n=1 Tax=Pyrocoelia pectoralis TaxID=417401 RepID=A0AAN7ZR39_9COLE